MFFLISGLKKKNTKYLEGIYSPAFDQHRKALGLMPTPEKQIHLFNYGLSAF